MATDYKCRTIDVRPAEGWQVAVITQTGLSLEPMPGWLVQEEVIYDTDTLEDVGFTGFRQIVASIYCSDDHELKPAAECGGFWRVIGPGQPEPSPKQAAEEFERRRREHDSQRRLIA